MGLFDRIFAITIMILILIFSVIHLGVSIGIIVPYRKYGDIFRPQIGLSSFNIAIGFFGLVIGILGIVSMRLKSESFARTVCFISGILGIFAIASLVSALVINAKSPSYVSSQFTSNLIAYKNNGNARSIIDRVQSKYRCCGTDMWIDWARGELNLIPELINEASNIPFNAATTIAARVVSGSTLSADVTATTSIAPLTESATILQTAGAAIVKRDIRPISNDFFGRSVVQFTDHLRKKRQTPLTYGGIVGLPTDFRVVFPRSCCTSAVTFTSNSSDPYCTSIYSGIVNHFYTAGCAKLLDTTAGNQAMGFGVINSVLLVLAFSAIPILLESSSEIV